MSSADHLAVIDLLCARDFPRAHGGSDTGSAGPGFHLAELGAYVPDADADPAAHDDAELQYEAERDALAVLLSDRWGEPQVFALTSVLVRALAGEEDLPEPWASVSETVPDVHLWRADGRWIALGVARRSERRGVGLVAVVTEVDPP
ncbi:hypothetical protein [Streptomyces sp. G45]|uniref:hypothetical protein n=1 Tax=Streptomyces sp. G45 TaxID=3406627 RepID=UPI003C152FA8